MRYAVVLAAILIPARVGHASPAAKAITKCIEIKKSGFYVLKNNLTGDAAGCLKITASKVTLDGNFKTITGVGTGTGLIVNGSDFVFNEFKIANFAVGVEVKGANAFCDNVQSNQNTDTGWLFNGTTGGRFILVGAVGNANFGVHLKSASNNIFYAGSTSGGKIGFWFDSSSGNISQGLSALNCSNTGVYLGCSSAGPGGVCNGASSNNNKFADVSVNICPKSFAIDAGSQGNVITKLLVNNAQDGNANCGSNLWFNNFINVADQACEN